MSVYKAGLYLAERVLRKNHRAGGPVVRSPRIKPDVSGAHEEES